MASMVLKIQTNIKGLSGPSQLTRLKLMIRMITPINSKLAIWLKIKLLSLLNIEFIIDIQKFKFQEAKIVFYLEFFYPHIQNSSSHPTLHDVSSSAM